MPWLANKKISRRLSFHAHSRANFKIQDIGLRAKKGFRLGEIMFFVVWSRIIWKSLSKMVTIFDIDLLKHRASDHFLRATSCVTSGSTVCPRVPNLKARLQLPQFQTKTDFMAEHDSRAKRLLSERVETITRVTTNSQREKSRQSETVIDMHGWKLFVQQYWQCQPWVNHVILDMFRVIQPPKSPEQKTIWYWKKQVWIVTCASEKWESLPPYI